MSDLISRRALLKKLESMTNDNSEYIRNNSHQFTYKELAYIICNQPTAYDIEKVVAELEIKFEQTVAEILDKTGSDFTIADFNVKRYSDRICEIVRKGGAE